MIYTKYIHETNNKRTTGTKDNPNFFNTNGIMSKCHSQNGGKSLMSVIVFDIEEMASIYKTLEMEVYGRDIYSLIPKEEIDYHHAKDYYDNDMEKLLKVKLFSWVRRIWIANQCAGIAQYGHHDDYDKTIKLFDESDAQYGKMLSEFELYEEIGSLSYNIYTNGGNSFVSEKDLKFLDHIREVIAQKHMDSKCREIKDNLAELERKRQELETEN